MGTINRHPYVDDATAPKHHSLQQQTLLWNKKQPKEKNKTTYELHSHSTYKLHNEKPLGFPKNHLSSPTLNLDFHE